jgi:hypothetical protein
VRCALAIAAVLAGCGDNVAEPRPDCSALAPPPTGLTLEAAREAHRRAALRQRLREREVVDPGYTLRATARVADQARIDRGLVCAQELYEVGRILFEHGYTFDEGLAAGPSAAPFQRVQAGRRGGPETNACTSCHWRGGPGGGGSFTDASLILGDGDRASSADLRNPPALVGAGVAQALAAEMTAELAALRERAIADARRTDGAVEVELVAKGVSYGMLRVEADGSVDTAQVRGIDGDLVVKPFGWKGTTTTLHEFIAEAAALHFGIQGEDAQAGERADALELGDGPLDDPDADGITDELTPGQVTALAVYIASLETPIMRPHERPVEIADPAGPTAPYLVDEWARGRVVFEEIGCAFCHRPSLVLDRSTVTLRSPSTGGAVELDLARDAEAPRIAADPAGGWRVFVFSDFKRHDLGDENASRHREAGISRRFYLTRRLWGVASSGPYFYDGQAATIDHAIDRHGGEAADARAAWRALSTEDRSALRVFLTSLRREPRLVVP